MSDNFDNRQPTQYSNQAWDGNQTGPVHQNQQGWSTGPNSYQQQPTTAVDQNTDAAGFFKALFDVSFRHFVTPKVVRFIYVLAMVAIVLTWLVFLMVALAAGDPMLILLVFVVGPIMAILYLTFIRMTLEFYLATVRMSEDIHHRLR